MPKGAVCAEVGVAFGDYSAEIIARTTPSKLYLVDAWGSARVEIRRGFSTVVLAALPDDHLDWVYIDTNHSFETTMAELTLCDRKVKADGLVAGHDFCTGNLVAATSIAFLVLGGVTTSRSFEQSQELGPEVADLWGRPQRQDAPVATFRFSRDEEVSLTETEEGKTPIVNETVTRWHEKAVPYSSTDVSADIVLDQRLKGLIRRWPSLPARRSPSR